MTLDELLTECIDALRVPTWDGDDRMAHLDAIDTAVHSPDPSDDIRVLLRAAAEQFREDQLTPIMAFLAEDRREALAIADGIEVHAKLRYVYHGTIYGRLAGIEKEGLVPGKIKVWPGHYVAEEFLNAAVFFDGTWRGAMSWAEVAHEYAKGRRDGLHRTPAVIRLPVAGLTLHPDPIARAPNCVMMPGPVSADEAEVIIGRVRGFPKWMPLKVALVQGARP